jgi:hypothetical protein
MLKQDLPQQVRVERIGFGAARVEGLAEFGGHLGVDGIEGSVLI